MEIPQASISIDQAASIEVDGPWIQEWRGTGSGKHAMAEIVVIAARYRMAPPKLEQLMAELVNTAVELRVSSC